MSNPSDTSTTPVQPLAAGEPAVAAPESWVEALATLLAVRIALFRYESRAAAGHWVGIALRLGLAALAVLLAWLLLLAGGVAALAVATGWAWHWLALGTGAAHLLLAWILLKSAKTSHPTAFPLTRSEFEKDRVWLNTLTKPGK